MRAKFFFISFITGTMCITAYSQCPQCIITGDSIVALDTSGSIQTHAYYHSGWPGYQLEAIIDDLNPMSYDSIFYNGSGQIIKTKHPGEEYNYTYTGGLVSRVDGSGADGGGPWTKSYNVFYSGGLISSIMLDTNSVIGNPVGIPGSFISITWSNGNPVTLGLEIYPHLAIDTTYSYEPLDTIYAAAIYDTACNVTSMLFPYRGAEGLLSFMAANNGRLTLFTNSVPFLGASPGDTIDAKEYTYNGNNSVNSVEMLPTFFDDYHKITYYSYNCNIAGIEDDKSEPYTMYPNPVNDLLRFKFKSENQRTIQLINSNGTVISTFISPGSQYQIDVSALSSGIYFVMIIENGTITSKKFIRS